MTFWGKKGLQPYNYICHVVWRQRKWGGNKSALCISVHAILFLSQYHTCYYSHDTPIRHRQQSRAWSLGCDAISHPSTALLCMHSSQLSAVLQVTLWGLMSIQSIFSNNNILCFQGGSLLPLLQDRLVSPVISPADKCSVLTILQGQNNPPLRNPTCFLPHYSSLYAIRVYSFPSQTWTLAFYFKFLLFKYIQ